MEDQGHQAMWPQMIAALAAIDAELGIPDDGCNSTGQTLAAIRALKAKAEIAQSLARTVMADQTSSDMRPDAGLAERAADMLTAYAELIRRDGASHVEEHHYLPEVEHTARELRQFVFGA